MSFPYAESGRIFHRLSGHRSYRTDKALFGTAGWDIDDVFVYCHFLTDAQIEFIRTQGANALACPSFDQDGDGLLGCATTPYQDACPQGGPRPGEVPSLRLSHNKGTGATTLNWGAPTGSATSYDTLRSTTATAS